jgi:hypothetical protein
MLPQEVSKSLTKKEELILLMVKASRRWKRPPDYSFIYKETGARKADVLSLLQREEI